jgi:hypothetical protein
VLLASFAEPQATIRIAPGAADVMAFDKLFAFNTAAAEASNGRHQQSHQGLSMKLIPTPGSTRPTQITVGSSSMAPFKSWPAVKLATGPIT